MDDRERGAKVSPEIYVYATNKNFLNIYDALRIEKVKIEIAGYDPATNKQTGIAGAWLDADDLRLLIHLVLTRQFKDVLDRGRFEKFGGSERDGAVESRTILVEWDPGDNGRFARFPYRLTIANGPGQRTENGAVQPKGEPTTRLAMRLPEADWMKIMLAVGAYLSAYESSHHEEVVGAKVRELQQKLAERPQRPLAERQPPVVPDQRRPERPAAAYERPTAPTPERRPEPVRERPTAPSPVRPEPVRERPAAAVERPATPVRTEPVRERPAAAVERPATPVRERPVAEVSPAAPVRERPQVVAPVRQQTEPSGGLRVVSRQDAPHPADEAPAGVRRSVTPPAREEELRPTGSAPTQPVRRAAR